MEEYTKQFTYDELLCTLDIIEAMQPYCKTRRQKEKIKLSKYKYDYWLLISRVRGNSPIVIGQN